MDAGERKAAIGIDWLQGTIPFERFDMLFEYLDRMCCCTAEHKSHGLMTYQAAAEYHPFGIKLLWDLDQKNRNRHGGRICLQLCGSAISSLPPTSLLQFMHELATQFWFKATRIDLAFDDYEKIIRPMEVFAFAEQGSYKGFGVHGIGGKSRRNGESKGKTADFGERGKMGGGKYLRCYDKDIQSGGEIDAIRWEVEFTKTKANAIFFDLAMSSDVTELATKIASYIGGTIDFIERLGFYPSSFTKTSKSTAEADGWMNKILLD